jgi:hypothetical protein
VVQARRRKKSKRKKNNNLLWPRGYYNGTYDTLLLAFAKENILIRAAALLYSSAKILACFRHEVLCALRGKRSLAFSNINVTP